MRNGRVTARIRRTADGDLHQEYCVGGVSFGSLDALETVLDER